MNIHTQPFGSGIADFFSPVSASLTSLLQPRTGRVIATAAAPAALSLGVVAALAGTVLLVASLKKKRLL